MKKVLIAVAAMLVMAGGIVGVSFPARATKSLCTDDLSATLYPLASDVLLKTNMAWTLNRSDCIVFDKEPANGGTVSLFRMIGKNYMQGNVDIVLSGNILYFLVYDRAKSTSPLATVCKNTQTGAYVNCPN